MIGMYDYKAAFLFKYLEKLEEYKTEEHAGMYDDAMYKTATELVELGYMVQPRYFIQENEHVKV
jgi:hypothetical protein